jgi:hypothetical protein
VLNCPTNPITNPDPVYNHYHVTLYLLLLRPFVGDLLESINVKSCVGVYVHGVHCAALPDFSVRGAVRRHFSRQVAQLFRGKFRR